MKRRSFLAALTAAPLLPVAAKAAMSEAAPAAADPPIVLQQPWPFVFEDGVLKLCPASISGGTISLNDGATVITPDGIFIRS